MLNPVAAVCQSCRGAIAVEYVRLGAAVRCGHCLRVTVPVVPEGGEIPMHGWELTFHDFCRLLDDPADRQAVGPVIFEWYGFSIEQAGPDALVRGRDGVPVDKLWLHLEIQANPGRQAKLYQVAMNLWR